VIAEMIVLEVADRVAVVAEPEVADMEFAMVVDVMGGCVCLGC